MRGVNASTGKPLAGIEHLRQSVRDILSTPVGSRVMRRGYGSQLFRLVDAPLNASTRMDLFAATADALAQWEPRIAVEGISASQPRPGVVVLDLVGRYLPDGTEIAIDGIEVN